jgi:hypothetical protein
MKSLYVSLFLALLFFSGNAVVHAQLNCQGQAGCTYTPLEPLPTGDASAQTGQNFPAFVSGLFRVLITIGGLFAVVMLVVAGIGYMLSEAPLDMDKAKTRAKAALWGLLLLTGSWLILNSINPEILRFKLLLPGSSQAPANSTPVGQSSATSNATAFNGDSVTISNSDPAAAAAQEQAFRSQCENRQGSVTALPGREDGASRTYGCVVPN